MKFYNKIYTSNKIKPFFFGTNLNLSKYHIGAEVMIHRKWSMIFVYLFTLSANLTAETWNLDADGNWNVDANWTPATFPNGTSDVATFSNITTAVRTVTLGQLITVGSVSFDSPFGYIITGADQLNFNNAGTASINLTNTNGNGINTISAPMVLTNDVIMTHSSPSDFTLSGAISGAEGIIKEGAGPGALIISGSTANTYGSPTTVNNGLLQLNKTPGVVAIPASVVINTGATVSLLAPNQLNPTATLINIAGGTFNMNGFDETASRITFNAGTLNQGGGLLTLTSNITPLFLNNGAVISGNIALTGTGNIISSGATTNIISGNLDLGGITRSFSVGNSASLIDMLITGAILNGGVTKTGAGLLYLTGPNTYTGGTLVSAGTLEGDTVGLQGNITNNASLIFNQPVPGTYAGILSGAGLTAKIGTGSLTVTNTSPFTGTTNIAEGAFIVNGTYGNGGTLIANPGTTIAGTGIIAQNSTIYGILSPGNSIGTIFLVGAQTLATGSALNIEISPVANDLVDITGTLTIESGVTLNVLPTPGTYTTPFSRLIVHTTAGVTGVFSTITSLSPLLIFSVVYTPVDIFLQGTFSPFSPFFTSGNAAAVAHCLDTLPSPAGSDLAFVINQLYLLPTLGDIKNALLQLQPSAFTSLALAQENNTLQVKDAVFNRLDQRLHSCIDQNYAVGSIWGTPLIGFSHQKNRHEEPGFNDRTAGVLVGIDYSPTPKTIYGTTIAYTHTNLCWNSHRGNACIDSVYGGLYARWQNDRGFLEGVVTGDYNHYNTKRHIEFSEIDRKAKGHHHGAEVSVSLKGALVYQILKTNVSPFASADFIYLHETAFSESKAQSLNLKVRSKNSNLLVGELGLDVSRCFARRNINWTPFIQVSALHENRFTGSHETGLLNKICPMHVKGLSPTRTLGGLTIGLNGAREDSVRFFTLYYKGKYNNNFQDHSINLDLSF